MKKANLICFVAALILSINLVARADEQRQLNSEEFSWWNRAQISYLRDRWQSTSSNYPTHSGKFTHEQQKINISEMEMLNAMTKYECNPNLFSYARISNLFKWSVDSQTLCQNKNKYLYSKGKQVFTQLIGLQSPDTLSIYHSDTASSIQDFVAQTRAMDPDLSDADIFQASRNVWTANVLQLFQGVPVKNTPAIMGYSLLYPYTDNYLDSDTVTKEEKKKFAKLFGQRLSGKDLEPTNKHVEKVFEMVRLMESEFPRDRFPEVWHSILEIHRAQVRSLQQQVKFSKMKAPPTQILDISIDKGANSVLADAYLVKGGLTPKQFQFAMIYGFVLQLVDDLQDVKTDLEVSHSDTIFTLEIKDGRKLDAITNQFLTFLNSAFDELPLLLGAELGNPVKETMIKFCRLLAMESISKHKDFYSRDYYQKIQEYSPLDFRYFKSLDLEGTIYDALIRVNPKEL